MPATIALGEGHLYERDFELERIDAALAAARRGNGGVLVVEGAAGIGKTSLGLAARLSATAAGMTVLTARGAGLERDFAWGVVRQWFSTELAGLSPGERADVLGGAAALAADALGEPAPGARAGTSLPGMLHGLHWLIANLSQRAPVLLVLDDAHWADEPSLRLVSYLGARAPDLPVLVLVATRPAAQGAAPHALAAVVSDPEAAVLRPAPLSEPAMQILVEARSGRKCDPDFARACRLATGGNPFLLGELVRALDEAGVTPRAEEADRVAGIRPRALSAAILGRLPAESQALARAVAVLDVDAGLAAASELAGLSVDAATEAAAELTRAGLLEDRLPLRFVHALVRAAVADGLQAGERSSAHARAAEILRAGGAPAHVVAAHLMATQPRGDQAVVRALRAAARDAVRRGGPAAAAAQLTRALEEPVEASARPALVEELAGAKLLARDPAAGDHLRAALDLAPDAAARARIVLLLGEWLLFSNQRRESHDLMVAARAALGGTEPDLALRLDTQLAQLCWTTASMAAEQEQRLEDLEILSSREGAAAGGLALSLALRKVLRGQPAGEALADVRRVLDGGRFLAVETSEGVSMVQAITALAFVDALDDADRLLDEMSADASERGSPIGYAAVGTWRSYVALRRGLVAAAEAEARTVLEHLNAHGLAFAAGFATAYLGIALTEQGRLAEAASALDPLPFDPVAGTVAEPTLREARGLLRMREGRMAEAAAEFRTCGSVCDELLLRNPAVHPWRSQLALSLPPSDREQALELVSAELTAARAAGVPRAVGGALRAEGLLAGEDGTELLRASLAALDGCPSGLERATTLLHLGAALRRENHRIEAREPLHEALELADAIGAEGLAESARRELRAAGSRPRRVARTGVAGLSPQEQRIAALAAQGQSNPNIAQALFLSRRTVEMHLGNAYRKLGIASRRDLPRALQPPS
jgi:DNA-binding CsgD family transcriptional regulator